MGNEALEVNDFDFDGLERGGVSPDIHLTTEGSNWLWAVCAVFGLITLVLFAVSFTRPRHHRIPYYIASAITLVAAIDYFTQASNLGWTGVPVQFVRGNAKVAGLVRQIFYVRYIDWFITTPLMLLLLLRTAAVPWAIILFTLFLNQVMIVCGLVASLIRTRYKWGYFAFGCAALLGVLYHVFVTGRKHARPLGSEYGRAYTVAAGILLLTWILYPIAFGLSEGGNVIAVDSEAIFYGVLDLVSKVLFLGWLLFSHRKLEPARMGLHVRDFNDLPSHIGEKHHHNNGTQNPVLVNTVPVTTVPVTSTAV